MQENGAKETLRRLNRVDDVLDLVAQVVVAMIITFFFVYGVIAMVAGG